MTTKDELLAEYRNRFKLRDKFASVLRAATEILYEPDPDKLLEQVFDHCSMGFGCLALGLQEGHAPNRGWEVKHPSDWGGHWDTVKESLLQQNATPVIIEEEEHEILTCQPSSPKSTAQDSSSDSDQLVFVLNKLSDTTERKDREVAVRSLASQVLMVKRIHQEKTTNKEILKALTRALDARDNYTRGHSERVANYARATAKSLPKLFPQALNGQEGRLSFEEYENKCYYSGLLHDVGKIAMDDFFKSSRHLTGKEFLLMKTHVRESARILSEITCFKRFGIDEAALHHHESYDGYGYLKKCPDELSSCAQILAIADSYDAMTSDRSYRNKYPWDVALDDLRTNSLFAKAGSQFYNPLIFMAFEHAMITDRENVFRLSGDKRFKAFQKKAVQFYQQGPPQKEPDQNKDKYKSILQQAGFLHFDTAFPGTCKVFLNHRHQQDIETFANNGASCFSLALVKWQTEVNKVNRLQTLNRAIQERGQKDFTISSYDDDLIMVHSLIRSDREIYELLASLPYRKIDKKFQTSKKPKVNKSTKPEVSEGRMLACISSLQREPLAEGVAKIAACAAALRNLEYRDDPIIHFYRDIRP